MKILTLGLSPFYFTRNSKIHDTIIRNISTGDKDILLSSIFMEHDVEYFPQESISSRYSGVIGTFYNTNSMGDQLVTDVFDIVDREDPDVVLAIGGFSELEYIRAVKRVSPDGFSWIIILTSNIDDKISEFSETMLEADHVVCLTEKSYSALKSLGVDVSLFKYGIGESFSDSSCSKDEKGSVPTFIINDKNVQQSNLALVLDSFSSFVDREFKLILHTNYHEAGDYDLDHLISKFNISHIEIPDKFIGMKEGESVNSLIEKYRRAHFVIDLSIKPITSLCVLEAMSQGCIPIINKVGAVYEEIISDDKYAILQDFMVDNSLFFGGHLEPFYMTSRESFCSKVERSINLIRSEDGESFSDISESSKSMTFNFLDKGFYENIRNLIINGNFNTKKELKLKL